MAKVLRTPLKPGRGGTKSINALAAAGTLVPAATTAVRGTVLKGVAVVNASDAATALTQLNALLASLRTAGVITT